MILKRKFFNRGALVVTSDGIGLFPRGDTFTGTYLYNFAGDTITGGGTTPDETVLSAGFGIPEYAIVLKGGSAASPSNITYKYTFPSNTAVNGALLVANSNWGAAATNATVGIVARGLSAGSTAVDSYTHSASTFVAGTALTAILSKGSCVGTSTHAIFALGGVSTSSNNTNKYTYAGATTAVATSLTNGSRRGSTAGNSTVGIFHKGDSDDASASSLTTRYTYAGDVAVAGTSVANGTPTGTISTGNSQKGIFVSSGSASVQIYTFSSDAVNAGPSSFPSPINNSKVAVTNGVPGVSA